MRCIAHRGASGYAPENTLLAFDKALEIGCDMIECDVHVCASGEVIVFHDKTTKRMSGRRGTVAEMPLEALKALSLPENQHIPTLDEALDRIGARAKICIEIKPQGMEQAVAECITRALEKGKWKKEDFLVIAFNYSVLETIKHILPWLAIGAAIDKDNFHKAWADVAYFSRKMRASALHPDFRLIDEAFVKEAHKHGLAVNVWTVNKPADIARMRALGVDSVTTDYPERVKR